MRLITKTKYGNEVILAQERWFTFSEMNFDIVKEGIEYSADVFDNAFYIENGIAEFTISGTTMQWGYGKTVLIKKGTKYRIIPISTPLKIFRISNRIVINGHYSEGNKKCKQK